MQGSSVAPSASTMMTGSPASTLLRRQQQPQRQQSHIGARQVRVVARSAGGRGGGGRGGGGRGGGRGNPARQPQSRPRPPSSSSSSSKPAPPPLPETGYFAPADTKATVYAPLAGRETGDFSKRGGRWSPEFIWNTNWVEQLDYQEKLKEDRKADAAKRETEQLTGSLSLTRMADLDSMDMDLSKQLAKKKKKPPSLNMGIVSKKKKGRTITKEVYVPPSQGEARRWARSGRFAKKVVKVVTTEEEEAAAEAEREADQERFDKLKQELRMLNLGTTAALFAATYAFYPVDVAYSYLFGALGGAQYLGMLNRSVESYGSENAMGGVGGQQRTLIPVILALGFNRFNELASDQTGVTLQLLPILVGFFTYKISVITKSSLALFKDLSTNYGADLPAAEEYEGAVEDDAELRAEADYRDKIMRG